MTEPISMRCLAAADLVDYKDLRDAMLAAHPLAFSSDAAQARLQSPESYGSRLGPESPTGGEFTLGAWQGAGLIGAIGCTRDMRVKVRHIGHVVGMMVRDEQRGRGVGRALLDGCIAQARRSADLELLTLSVTEGNTAAIRLYEHAGFTRYGSLPRAICVGGQYHAKHLMVLAL
jgi:ribosomal protein S18 acetylase RimI-like enzyme